jgi:CHAT domain-containing protein
VARSVRRGLAFVLACCCAFAGPTRADDMDNPVVTEIIPPRGDGLADFKAALKVLEAKLKPEARRADNPAEIEEIAKLAQMARALIENGAEPRSVREPLSREFKELFVLANMHAETAAAVHTLLMAPMVATGRGKQDSGLAHYALAVGAFLMARKDRASLADLIDVVIGIADEVASRTPPSKDAVYEARQMLLQMSGLPLYAREPDAQVRLLTAYERLAALGNYDAFERFWDAQRLAGMDLMLADGPAAKKSVDRVVSAWTELASHLPDDRDVESQWHALWEFAFLARAVGKPNLAARLAQATGQLRGPKLSAILSAESLVYRERLARCGVAVQVSSTSSKPLPVPAGADLATRRAVSLLLTFRERLTANFLLRSHKPVQALASLERARLLAESVGWAELRDDERAQVSEKVSSAEFMAMRVSPLAIGVHGVVAAWQAGSRNLDKWLDYWIRATPGPDTKINAAASFARLVLLSDRPSSLAPLQLTFSVLQSAIEFAISAGRTDMLGPLVAYQAEIHLRAGEWEYAAAAVARIWSDTASRPDATFLKSDLRLETTPRWNTDWATTLLYGDDDLLSAAFAPVGHKLDFSYTSVRLEQFFRIMATTPTVRHDNPGARQVQERMAFSLSNQISSTGMELVIALNAAMRGEADGNVVRGARAWADALTQAADMAAYEPPPLDAPSADLTRSVFALVEAIQIGFLPIGILAGDGCGTALQTGADWAERPELRLAEPPRQPSRQYSTSVGADAAREARQKAEDARSGFIEVLRGADSKSRRKWPLVLTRTEQESVLRNLNLNDVIIQLVVISDAVYVVATTHTNGTKVAGAASLADVRRMVEELRTAVAQRPVWTGSPMPAASHEIFMTLIQPAVRGSKDIRRILLMPAPELADLPVNALLTAPWKTTRNYADQAWLDKSYLVRQVASLAPLYNRRPGDAKSEMFVGIGKPTLIGGAARGRAVAMNADQPWATGAAGVSALCPVESTKDILQGLSVLASSHEPQLLIGPDVTLSNLRRHEEDIRRASIVAFATHALRACEAETLGRKAIPVLVLTPQPPTHDGLLGADEIASLGLNADTVILAACGSGVRDAVSRGSWRRLSDAFLTGGARSVLVTAWSVDLPATDSLMQAAARHSSGAGKPLNERLRLAMQEMRDRAAAPGFQQPERQHPFYWAPFFFVGLADY